MIRFLSRVDILACDIDRGILFVQLWYCVEMLIRIIKRSLLGSVIVLILEPKWHYKIYIANNCGTEYR